MGKHQPHAPDVLSPSDGAGWDLPESSFLCLLRHRGNFPVPCVAPWGLTVTPTALPAPGTSPSLLQSPQMGWEQSDARVPCACHGAPLAQGDVLRGAALLPGTENLEGMQISALPGGF